MIIIDFCFLYFFVILMFNNILFYVIVLKLNFYLIYNPLMYLIDYRSIFSYAVTVFVLQFFVLLMINVILFYVIVFKLNFYLIYNHLMYIIDYRWFFISCYNFPFTYNLNILWFRNVPKYLNHVLILCIYCDFYWFFNWHGMSTRFDFE